MIDMYTISRHSSTPDGTFGILYDPNGKQLCVTCELPWLDNEPQKSCIPAGQYNVIPHNSPAHPNVWEIANVPDRSGILIHNGNTIEDSLGCVVVGRTFGTENGLPAVLYSKDTLTMLRTCLPDYFELTIK